MNVYSSPGEFLQSVEKYSGKTFHFRQEIVTIIETASRRGMEQTFDDIVFNAKFITKALNLIKRVGSDTADTEKLSIELKEMMEKTTTLLRTVMKESNEEVKNKFLNTFFVLSHQSMNNLVGLLYELHWVKNYLLDHRDPS